jgi:general secretion pathway protein A
MRVAGALHSPFSNAALARIHKHSGGVPRLVNVIAERALLGGYAHDATKIEAIDIDRAAREALAPMMRPRHHWRWAAAAALVVASIGAWFFWPRTPPANAQATPVVAKQESAKPAPAKATPAAKPSKAKPVPTLDADALAGRLIGMDANGVPAWESLLSQWNSKAEANVASACPPAIEPGLYCLRGTATLDKLFAQGRPALLHLRTQDAATWALLLGADAVRVRLQVGADTVDVDRVALQRAWTGEYASVWRGPEALAETPSADGRGPAVDWVHAHLPDYRGPAVLDAAMRDAVRGFQQSRGLATDGVVGPETLLALAARDPGPRLRTSLD